tara:strand:- start:772 stop:936 length:165 start_codon:yes stop_codon:yes gene_type:complete
MKTYNRIISDMSNNKKKQCIKNITILLNKGTLNMKDINKINLDELLSTIGQRKK